MKYLLAIVAVLAIGVFALFPSGDANAANKNDFNPGYIIDDYVFYNAGAMDSNQIQNFLNSKNPNCDYWGTQPASDWGYPGMTHAQLAEHKRNGTNGFSKDTGFHAPPYRCLTMYSQDTPQMEAASSYCGAMSAGNRTAAQIINDVAKACGINPQVLIILLEKEQSLVTDKWPLNRQLQKATGFGCPDTAPCNPAYEGFFYQVYNAARQFKVYKAFPNNYNYRAGRDNNIYWHPDLSRCGSSSVWIQNQATAALYIYTPYRPNDAALNNLYGTGDSCSSYGNRNFWRIFTDWFGSTKAPAGFNEIISRYTYLGGESGILGAQTGPLIFVENGRSYQAFTNGVITWHKDAGAWETINGPLRDRWVSLGASTGPLGAPAGEITTINANVKYQSFQKGVITWHSSTGAWETINGAVRTKWVALGASSGPLGTPVGGRIETPDGRVYQYFENGAIFWTNKTNAHEVMNGAIRSKWASMGGSVGSLGLPVVAPVNTLDGRTYQYFERGAIFSKDESGTFSVHSNAIRTRWANLGGSTGVLGMPTADQVETSDGRRYQYFENGAIFWTSTTGAHEVMNGAIRTRWGQLGGSVGQLGVPVATVYTYTNNWKYQQFSGGVIVWKDGVGAWESLYGPIRTHWVASGASPGVLGSPAGPITSYLGNGKQQNYQNGTIFWTPSGGAWHILNV